MSSAGAKGRVRQKLRTRRQILEATSVLIAAGGQPTVTEAADAAGVSRRTAYRYFPSQAKLHGEAALEGLRPLMEAAIVAAPQGSSDAEIETRVVTLVRTMQKLTVKNEQLLRTMIHATVLEPPQGTPKRGIRRVEWVELSVAPLRSRLPLAAYRRLVSALSLCVGTEAMIVFRDIRGMTGAQAITACEWLALAALRATLDEARRR
jgi:AcrR family transcriptional regulator